MGMTTNSYDASDNLTSVIESNKTNTWTYDAYNRVSTYKDVFGNLIQYRYDANGNMTNLVYPGSKNVYYAYDSNNHMTNVTDWAGRKTSIAYDLDGRITGITRPNGTCRTLGYDAAGQLTNVWEQMAQHPANCMVPLQLELEADNGLGIRRTPATSHARCRRGR